MNSSGPFQLRWRGQISGPHTLADIQQMLAEREIGLWHEIGSGGEWVALGDFLDQLKQERAAAVPTPPPLPAAPRPSPGPRRVAVAAPPPVPAPLASAPRRPRRLLLFVLLGALLGFTGAHNFYAGYRGTAFAQLLLSALTLALGFGFFVSWVWALIELLIVHTDAKGVRLR